MIFIKILFMVFLTINCAGGGQDDSAVTHETKSSQDAHVRGPWIRSDGTIFGANSVETGYYRVPSGDIYDNSDAFSGFAIINSNLENHLGQPTGYRVLGSGALSGCADFQAFPQIRKIFGIWSPLADVGCKTQ